MLDKLFAVLGKMPSTNARIAMTLVLAFGTGVKYWASTTWEPSWEWLSFLVLWAGLDVAQFTAKRRTWAGSQSPQQ